MFHRADAINGTVKALQVVERWSMYKASDKEAIQAFAMCYLAEVLGIYDEAYKLYEINKVIRGVTKNDRNHPR